MRINTNMLSLFAYNASSRTNVHLAKSIERLSTGLRINSAADDAAGMAISEKMRAQMHGLDKAAANAQDGISLLQTADGALNEIQSIMQRMRELSLQSVNDALIAEDRMYIQQEIDELTKQIDDIANQTLFNKKKLLNGDSSVIWSTTTYDLSVLVSGALRPSEAGNYKITFQTTKTGQENIQKSNIFSLKNGTISGNVDHSGLSASGLLSVQGTNLVEGTWRIETSESPVGGAIYYEAGAVTTEGVVGAALSGTASPSTVPHGEYNVRVSDTVPIMVSMGDANAAGVVDDINISSLDTSRDFDASFETGFASNTSGSMVYQNNGAGNVSMSANTTDTNVFSRYNVDETDQRDTSVSAITVIETYITATDAEIDINLEYQSRAGETAQATLTYAAADDSIDVQTTYRTDAGATMTMSKAVNTHSETVGVGDTLDDIVQNLNSHLSAAGISVTASLNALSPGQYELVLTHAGSSADTFEIDGALAQALGIGGTTLSAGNSATAVIAVTDDITPAGLSGDISFKHDSTLTVNVGNMTVTEARDTLIAAAGGNADWAGVTFGTAASGGQTRLTVTNGTGNDVTFSGAGAANLGIAGTGATQGTLLDYNTTRTVTGLSGLGMSAIAARIDSQLSAYGISASTTGGTNARRLQIGASGNYSVNLVSGGVLTDLGMVGRNIASGSTSSSNTVYDGYTVSGIDTGGKTLSDIASALTSSINGLSGVSGFQVDATSSLDNEDTLIADNGSMYNIVISGATISELNNGQFAISRGVNNRMMANEVYNNKTFTVNVANNYMNAVASALNGALQTALAGDDLSGNNSLGSLITFSSNATTGDSWITLANSNNSGYNITLNSTPSTTDTVGEIWSGGASVQRGGSSVQSDALSYNKRIVQLAAGRNIEQIRSAVNGAGTSLQANWNGAAMTPGYDGSHHYGQLNLVNTSSNASGAARGVYTINESGSDGGLYAKDSSRRLLDSNSTFLDIGDSETSNVWQARDALRLTVNWEGIRSDTTIINSGSATVGSGSYITAANENSWLWEGDAGSVNAAKMNAATAGGSLGNNFYATFNLADSTASSDRAKGSSWIFFTQANVASAITLTTSVGDSRTGSYGPYTYAFDRTVLDNKDLQLQQMLYRSGEANHEVIYHNIDFGANASTTATSFQYGERGNAGNYNIWGLDNTEGVDAWYSHTYYGNDTTYYFQNGSDPMSVIKSASVFKQNNVNASLMFEYINGQMIVRMKGFACDNASKVDDASVTLSAAQLNTINNGGAITIHGINFTNLHIDVAALSNGDKFVINVAAAAALQNANLSAAAGGFESYANISITGDPFLQDDPDSWGTSMQYRLRDGAEHGEKFDLLGFFVHPVNGASNERGVGYYDGSLVLEVDANGFNKSSGVGAIDGAEAGSYTIQAEMNYLGDAKYASTSMITSGYFQKMEENPDMIVADFVRGTECTDYEHGARSDGTFGALNEAGQEVYSKMNGSLIFDLIAMEPNVLTFRIQAHLIDRDGNQWYAEEEEYSLFAGHNTDKDTSVDPPIIPAEGEVIDFVRLFANSEFGGIYFEEFNLGDYENFTVGDRFTISLVASAFNDGASITDQMSDPDFMSDVDTVYLFSDHRGTNMPHTFRFNDGFLDNNSVDLHIYQLANNYEKKDSVFFSNDQVMDGTLSLTFGDFHPGGENSVHAAATFEVVYRQGMNAGVAHYYSKTEDIAQFWDANGNFILGNNGDALTIRQGERETKIVIKDEMELGQLAKQISDLIWLNLLKQRQRGLRGENDRLDPAGDKWDLLDEDDKYEIFKFINSAPGKSPNESVYGTFLAHSVLSGTDNSLKFLGSEALLKAFAFNTIQDATNTEFRASVYDAHSGKSIQTGTKVMAGTAAERLLFENIGLWLDSDLGLQSAVYDENKGTFVLTVDRSFSHTVHLADNALTLQIGANQGENLSLSLGDMTARALGINNLCVRSRETAARSITLIDNAVVKVSRQRSIVGSLINRLQYAANSITVASANLNGAMSRISFADMAKEMMDFTKLSILSQANNAILSQANLISSNVLALLQ